MKHAIVENGTVVNVVEWDVVSEWSPGPDQQAIASDTAKVGDSYAGGEFVSPARPEQSVTVIDITHERNRRLALGFDYNFGDARGVHRIGTSPADMVGWGEVSTYAGALLDMGDVETKIAIVTDTGPCEVTAPEWRAIEVAAATFRQPIWARSFVLQALLPTDYATDAQWT